MSQRVLDKAADAIAPLGLPMQPLRLGEVVGQEHSHQWEGKILRRMIESDLWCLR